MFKISIFAIAVISFINLYLTINAQDKGEQLFNTICIACHTIGEGKLLGPDLENVHKRHSEEWMIKFIRSSQNMIKEGDEEAVKLFNENNMIIMPDNAFTDEQIKSIIAYIQSKSGVEEIAKGEKNKTTITIDQQKQAPSSVATSKTQTQTPESKSVTISYETGEQLFDQNCTACHAIGKGTLVGPDLKGINSKHQEEWLLKYIKSSQTMIQSGDGEAVAIYKQFNEIVMPDQTLTNDEIRAILIYISNYKETTSVETTETKAKGLADPSLDEKKQGGSDLKVFLANPVIIIVLISIIILLVIIARLSYTLILLLRMLKDN